MIKKTLNLLLCLILAFGLVACISDKPGEDKAKESSTEQVESSDAELSSQDSNQDVEASKEEYAQMLADLYEQGIPYADEPALRIEDQELSVGQLNLYAALAANVVSEVYASGPFSPENRSNLDLPDPNNPDRTQREAILELARKQALMDYYCQKQAKAESFKPSQSGRELAAGALSQVLGFAEQSGFDPSQLLTLYYGWGNDAFKLIDRLANYFDAEQYRDHYSSELTVSDKELKAELEENPELYEAVTFRVISFAPDKTEYLNKDQLAELAKQDAYEEKANLVKPGKDQADISQEELLKNAHQRAEAMAARIESEDDFVRLQALYGPGPAKAQLVESPDLTKQTLKVARLPKEMKHYLNDAKRKAGDFEVIDSPFGSWLVYFLERGRDESRAYTTRHILIQPAEAKTDKDWAEAKKQAEKILADYQDGDQTEEAFAKLANEKSQDPGNKTMDGQGKGGLYESILPGQFVPEYEQWSLAKGRKPGDVEIVKSTHGYHIIYFVSLGDPQWRAEASMAIRLTKTREWLESELAKLDHEDLEAMKYVLPTVEIFGQ